nr:unnamed protein product [Callosobruchus analis]
MLSVQDPPSQNGQPTKHYKKRLLVPWTEEQKALVTAHFSDHIKNKKPPKRKECEQLKKNTMNSRQTEEATSPPSQNDENPEEHLLLDNRLVTNAHLKSNNEIAIASARYIEPSSISSQPMFDDLEKRKGNKSKDFCIYCESYVLNFARHLERNHGFEIDVQKIISLPPKSKERKEMLSILRKKGNYLNSSNAKKPVRVATTGKDYLPCSSCFGLYSSKQLWRHRKHCCKTSRRDHKAAAQNMLFTHVDAEPRLKKKMRPDEISLQAKKDYLICAFATRYITTHREKHLVIVASRKMRELAKLLIKLKKHDPTITNLLKELKPKYFDAIVAATKVIAKYNLESGRFDSPTLALNMGTTLKQCCDIAILTILKRKQVHSTVPAAEIESELKTLKQLIEANWSYEISHKAAGDLKVNKWNKVKLIPLASDLKIFREYLTNTANSAFEKLEANKDVEDYTLLLETVFCRVLILNRRRPGELQRLPLYVYEEGSASEDQTYEEFSDLVTTSEKILMKTLKRVVIRGKRGRGVPVLFPSDVQAHIKNLLKHGNLFHSEPNIYLFGNPKTSEPICDNDNGDKSDDELCLEETISSPPSQKKKRLLVPWTEEQKALSSRQTEEATSPPSQNDENPEEHLLLDNRLVTNAHLKSNNEIAIASARYIEPSSISSQPMFDDLEKRKGNKSKDFCIYCESYVLNFARHLERNHGFEIDVQKIISLPPKSKERKEMLSILRKKGNYLNSSNAKKPVRVATTGKIIFRAVVVLVYTHPNNCGATENIVVRPLGEIIRQLLRICCSHTLTPNQDSKRSISQNETGRDISASEKRLLNLRICNKIYYYSQRKTFSYRSIA